MKKKVKKQITIKSFTCSLISLISCISLCFVCLFPVKKIYAEGEAGTLQTGKNILTLLLGQMGVELVGTAAAIDQYVQEAWQLFLNGLASPITPEAYTLTAIAGLVQWDDVDNVLSVPSDLYNLVSQWAQDISNTFNISDSTEYLNIGSVEIPDTGLSLPVISGNTADLNTVLSNGLPFRENTREYRYILGLNNLNTKFALYKTADIYYNILFVYTSDQYNIINSQNLNILARAVSAVSYINKNSLNRYNDLYYILPFPGQYLVADVDPSYTIYESSTAAINSLVSSSGSLLDNVYVNGNALLDDRIVSTDNGAQLELDPVLDQGITYTLDDVLTAVMDWVTTNTWPDMTTVFVDALPIVLDEPIDTVLIPTAPYVEVPQVLLPSNLPIIYNPECESLSACLVAGISAVSNDITSFYNSNESISNYANIILFVGVSFVALGVIRRHL